MKNYFMIVCENCFLIIFFVMLYGCNPFKGLSIENIPVVPSSDSNGSNQLSLTVEKVYPINGAAWLNYITAGSGSTLFDRADVACAGTESGAMNACIHAGDKLKVVITQYSACSNLELIDSASIFSWSCFVESGHIVFYSTGFKENKGIVDLIDFSLSDWKTMAVSLYQSSTLKGTSNSQKWWTTASNPIVALPDSSASAQTLSGYASGTILIASSNMSSRGYIVDQDSLGIVVKSGVAISLTSGTAQNCNYNTGESASPNVESLFCLGSQKYIWIEGEFKDSAHESPTLFALYSIQFSTFNNMTVSEGSDGNVIYLNTSNNNRLTNIRIQKTNGTYSALYLGNSNYNYIYDFRAAQVLMTTYSSFVEINSTSSYNILTKATFSQQNQYAITVNGTNNVITDIVAISAGKGIVFGGSKNTVSHVSSILMGNSGLVLTPEWAGSTTLNTVNQILTANNLFGIGMVDTSAGLLSQTAVYTDVDYNFSLYLDTASNNKFTNNMIFSGSTHPNTCTVSGGVNAGVINGTCANQGLSDAIQTTYAMPGTFTPIVGAIGVMDAVNASNNSTGTAAIGVITDFVNFENRYRGWGDSTWTYGNCNGAETCSIFDVRLKATDTIFRNTSGDGQNPNAAFVADSACPAPVNGSKALTDQSDGLHTFLINAQEIIQDGIGNDNGLCESGEACIYSPNFGAYQGHGDYKANGSCLFQDGTITGVKMYAYPLNGL